MSDIQLSAAKIYPELNDDYPTLPQTTNADAIAITPLGKYVSVFENGYLSRLTWCLLCTSQGTLGVWVERSIMLKVEYYAIIHLYCLKLL